LDFSRCPACAQVHDLLQPCAAHSALRLIDDVELDALPDAEWTIEHMSQRGTLEIVAGPSGKGKTTLCTQRGCHQATGRTFLGFTVLAAGPVIYAALEGIGAYKRKVHAWKQAQGINAKDRIGIYTINEPINLLRADAAFALVRASESIGEAIEFYVDTVARATMGNEDNDDFSVVVAHADIIRRETGARVTLIHHFGMDKTKGSRGGSALPAAADTVLSIDTMKDRHILRCDKQRDGAPFDPISLKLVPTGSTALFEACEGAAVPLFDSSARLEREIVDYLNSHSGTAGSAIAKALGRKKLDVFRTLARLKQSNRVDYQRDGRAMLWEPCS
jgi:hypothetical protein